MAIDILNRLWSDHSHLVIKMREKGQKFLNIKISHDPGRGDALKIFR